MCVDNKKQKEDPLEGEGGFNGWSRIGSNTGDSKVEGRTGRKGLRMDWVRKMEKGERAIQLQPSIYENTIRKPTL